MAAESLKSLLERAFPDADEPDVLDRLRRRQPARPAPPRLRRARRAARRWHHPRVANHHERNHMSDLRDQIKEIIDTEDVVLFMKGTPQWVMCGNSMRALEALRAVEAPITAVDILPNPQYRQELSALSGWPTI